MKRLVWLASYPKSGNTWMRMLFAAYQQPLESEFRLEDAFKASLSESRHTDFFRLSGREDKELSVLEIDQLREAVQLDIAQRIHPPILIKTHNARLKHNGYPLIRRELTLGAIYIVRNPLDVVDSFADHMGRSVDYIIDFMNDSASQLGSPSGSLVTQYLETWSNHVRQWCFQQAFPVYVVRYEDLLERTEFSLRNVLSFLGWELDARRIERAMSETQIEKLRELEKQKQFAEASRVSTSGRFFREGRAGRWEQVLSSAQIARTVAGHRDVMCRMGYSTEVARAEKIAR